VIDWATDLIDAIGVLGVAALVALENIFPPIPSELVLLLTGFNVSEGRFGYVEGVLAATVGSVVGAWFLYGVGRLLDEDRLERFLATIGKVVGLRRDDVHKGFEWFERHGTAVVLFGRLVPVVRSVVSIPAGAERMPLVRFSLLTAGGSLVWNSVWVGIGWGGGFFAEMAGKWGDAIQYGAVGLIAVGLVVLVVRARRRRKSE